MGYASCDEWSLRHHDISPSGLKADNGDGMCVGGR